MDKASVIFIYVNDSRNIVHSKKTEILDRIKDLNAEVDHDFPVGRVHDYSEYIFTNLYSNIIYIYFKIDFKQTLRSFNI